MFYTNCWESDEYARDRDGYMVLRVGTKQVRAHRLSFFLHYGYWPEVCRHRCDNPPCYNPTHLEDGTVADNNRDKLLRSSTFVLNRDMPSQYEDPNGYKREKYRRQKEGLWVYRNASLVRT